MIVEHLSLVDFRNYAVADVALGSGPNVFVGRNGLSTRSPLSFFEPFLERVLAGPDASRFEEARRLGRDVELADAVELALG